MRLPARSLAMLALVSVAACDPDGQDGEGAAVNTGTEAGDSGSAPVGIAVDCSFVFGDAQIDVTYRVGDGRTETPVGGKLIAGGLLDDSEFEGRSFSLVVYAEDGTVLASSLYQMDRTRLPENEFYGDHGFTGLHGVKDPEAQENVQFACFARDPGAAPHVWQD